MGKGGVGGGWWSAKKRIRGQRAVGGGRAPLGGAAVKEGHGRPRPVGQVVVGGAFSEGDEVWVGQQGHEWPLAASVGAGAAQVDGGAWRAGQDSADRVIAREWDGGLPEHAMVEVCACVRHSDDLPSRAE
jgi:hypothetical protein